MAKSYNSIKAGWTNPNIDSSTGTIKKKKYNEIKSSDYDFGVDESYVESFLNRSNNYFKNAENDSKDVNYNNASSLYSNYRTSWRKLQDMPGHGDASLKSHPQRRYVEYRRSGT